MSSSHHHLVLHRLKLLLSLSDGRDKTFKLLQYSLKLALILRLIRRRSPLEQHVKAAVSSFSTTRKMLRLGHWLEPWHALSLLLSSPSTKPLSLDQALAMLNLVLGLLNDLVDDCYCLARIKALPESWGHRVEPWSNRLWLATIVLDLRENNLSLIACDDEKQHQANRFWLHVTRMKLIMDLLFCSYDVFYLNWHDGWQTGTGLLSGMMSAYKLWDKISART